MIEQVSVLLVLVDMTYHEKIIGAILTTATARGPEKSVCPSEIARTLFPAEWRDHMQAVRDAAFDLSKNGKVVITQKGEPVDTGKVKGPIRITII